MLEITRIYKPNLALLPNARETFNMRVRVFSAFLLQWKPRLVSITSLMHNLFIL